MVVIERWLADDERERREAERAAEAAEDGWWKRFQSEVGPYDHLLVFGALSRGRLPIWSGG